MKELVAIIILIFHLNACKSSYDQFLNSTEILEPRIMLSDSLQKYVRYSLKDYAIINATLIDGSGGKIQENKTILIQNGRFAKIEDPSKINIPKHFTIINAQNKTIIPGIVGVHNHLHIPGFTFIGDIVSKLYLASGVTTIMTCGSAEPRKEVNLAKDIDEHSKIGPSIIPSAPFITGPGGNEAMFIPKDTIELRDTMQYWINQGVKWFKAYRYILPEHLKYAIEFAHQNNCKVTGHLCSVTFQEATKFGINGIEHGFNSLSDLRTNKNYGQCNGGRAYMDNQDMGSPEIIEVLQLMVDHEVSLTSTLAIFEASIPNRAVADERSSAVMSPYLLRDYNNSRKNHDLNVSDLTRNKRLRKIMDFEIQFFKLGGLLGAGVDAGRHVVPGYGDQRNFELLIESGFTTEEAIQIMTSNGAKILNMDNIGSIEVGKRADFVILNGKLEKNPIVIKNVELVFKEGIGYDPAKILAETHGKLGL